MGIDRSSWQFIEGRDVRQPHVNLGRACSPFPGVLHRVVTAVDTDGLQNSDVSRRW